MSVLVSPPGFVVDQQRSTGGLECCIRVRRPFKFEWGSTAAIFNNSGPDRGREYHRLQKSLSNVEYEYHHSGVMRTEMRTEVADETNEILHEIRRSNTIVIFVHERYKRSWCVDNLYRSEQGLDSKGYDVAASCDCDLVVSNFNRSFKG